MTRKCPKCGCRSNVIDTRETETTVRRVRACIKCPHRWTTWESTLSPSAILGAAERAIKELRRVSEGCAGADHSPAPDTTPDG